MSDLPTLRPGEKFWLRGYYHGGPTGKNDVEVYGWTGPHTVEFGLVGTRVEFKLDARRLERDGDELIYHRPESPGLELVGVQEAARMAGITAAGIHQAHQRGTMPEPIPVAGSDVLVWDRDEVRGWAATRRGRGRPRSA